MRSRYIEVAASEDETEAQRGNLDRDQAARESEHAVNGVDEGRLRMDVGRLDLNAAPALAQALGEPVRRAPLGVGACEPPLEGAELADDLHAPLRVHAKGSIAMAARQRFGPMQRSMRATESRRATEIVQRFIRRHSTPTRSQYSQKRRRMSSERLLN